jgi:urate oxidase
MPEFILHDQYGKKEVRVSKIKRLEGGRHEFVEASIDVVLEGDFARSFTHGDNTRIIATDSIRNTIYIKAKDDPWTTVESFGVALATHFIETYAHVSSATVTLREHLWHRIGGAAAAFTGSDGETPTAVVRHERGAPPAVEAGIDNLMIAKTTDSAFKDFIADEYRTLPDAEDRIFATVLTAAWTYSQGAVDFAMERAAVRGAMLARFADHKSLSVQQSIYLMCQAALEASGAARRVTLTMPNMHHLKFNLAPFQRENKNEVFHVTSEPFGWIKGTLTRA